MIVFLKILFWDNPKLGLFRLPLCLKSGALQKSTHTEEYRAFIDFLIAHRKSIGMTQQSLANSIGKPQSFVAKFENRERRLDVVEFVTICRCLSIDPCTVIKTVFR